MLRKTMSAKSFLNLLEKYKKIFYVLSILVFTQISCDQNKNSTNGATTLATSTITSNETKNWENDEYKIKISVPANWTMTTPNEGEIVDFTTPTKNYLAIRAYKLVFPGTIDEIRDRLEKSLKEQCQNCKLLVSENIKIGNLNAGHILIEGKLGVKDGLYFAIPFHNNTNSFTFIGFYTPDTKTEFEKELDEILKSIEFK